MKQLETFFVGAGLIAVAAARRTWHALLLTVLFPLLWAYRVGEHHMRGRSELWLEKLDGDQVFHREMTTLIFWSVAAMWAVCWATDLARPQALFQIRVERTVELGLPTEADLLDRYRTVPVHVEDTHLDELELPMSDAAEAYAADAYAEGFHDGIWGGHDQCENDYDDGYRDGRALGSEEGYHHGLIEASVCPRPPESATGRE
jgi:hypothetical protein